MVAMSRTSTQTYPNGLHLRHRLVLSTLSSRSVRFQNIRTDTQTPGLAPSEISFIRLLDKLTSGTTININETGTSLFYKPGHLLGGSISHDCHTARPIAYYLHPLLLLAPFCKKPIFLTLRGATHGNSDICADTLAAVSIPLLRRLALGQPLEPKIEVRRRGIVGGANGGGQGGLVTFSCGVLGRKLAAVDLINAGVVKRIRGMGIANRTSPTLVGRMVDCVRGALNGLLPDVYVHTDVSNGKDCGVGFGLQLAAESTEGCLLGADWGSSKGAIAPEGVARDVVNMLLEEICGGGCMDSGHVWLALGICAVAEEEVSRVKVGKLSESAVEFMRDLERFLGVVFNVKVVEKDEEESDEEDGVASHGIILSCIGVGLSNTARQRF